MANKTYNLKFNLSDGSKIDAGNFTVSSPETADDVNAISTEANQDLTETQQSNARNNIGITKYTMSYDSDTMTLSIETE